ncbi:MAG TPA: hypothetical protein VER79_09260 [Candidatus Limnocylindrales bacterium]|nr:hypothetical protein [Candidatus Limnocylindrales bacterium]
MTEWLDKHNRLALLGILAIGLLVRAYLLPTAGFALDLEQHFEWADCALESSWVGMYNCATPITHPPINPSIYGLIIGALRGLGADVSRFDGNSLSVAALKIHLVVAELLIVLLAFGLVKERSGPRWALLAAALLCWNPGWMVVTAWWGQNDASYSLFMLLVAALAARQRPRWAWAAYALAWLAKFQSIMFLPVFAVLSVRWFGWRRTAQGAGLFTLVILTVMLPFVLGSGKNALHPFGGTVNLFPYITNGAYNFWFWVSGSSPTVLLDSLPLVGTVTYQQGGLILLSIGTALLCLRAWFSRSIDEIYLIFAGAVFVFYMLPTQIQVRYLYPGLMFLAVALALARDRRLLVVYLGASLAFTYNVFDIVWLGVGLLYYPSQLMVWNETHTALGMTVVFLIFMGLLLKPLAALRLGGLKATG